MHVFVTVGTTRFDTLIRLILSQEFLSVLAALGYTSICLQIGNSDIDELAKPSASAAVKLEHYRFKPSLQDDMNKADLIISHAGAGCIMESLKLKKKCIAVVNEDLMGNHQVELAGEMHNRGYAAHLLMTTPSKILSLVQDSSFAKKLQDLVELPPPNTAAFGRIVDEEMGFKIQSQ